MRAMHTVAEIRLSASDFIECSQPASGLPATRPRARPLALLEPEDELAGRAVPHADGQLPDVARAREPRALVGSALCARRHERPRGRHIATVVNQKETIFYTLFG